MRKDAFTLIELLVVIAIGVIMAALIIPAISSLNNAANVNAATYQIKGVLESSRSYATANNTYVWVGFYEEAAASPGTPGIGRVVISVVASTDGTTLYTLSTPTTIPPASLIQVSKLLKINNIHLNNFAAGLGTGSIFATRPTVTSASQIGNLVPTLASPSATPFQYPVGSAASAQYTFSKAIQFSPRGEARVDNSSNSITPIVEIGLQPTHGSVIDAANPNVAAVQVTGVAGNVTIYRQ
jgi:prepilin-type N-terminal cleavage/methylation domain-containing protein